MRQVIEMLCCICLSVIGASVPLHEARAGANPDVHLALDMMSRAKTQSCASLAGRYLSCDSIRTALPDTGNFRAAVVVYDVESVTGVQYALSWPDDWEIESFTPCGTLTIGGEVTANPMDVSTAWSTAQTATGSQGILVGLLTGHATSPGCITIITPTYQGGLMVIDSTLLADSIETVLEGCVATQSSGDPCDFGELRAAFVASVAQGVAPLDVAFTDRSRGGAVSWLWDFGDGATSTERSPRHTYIHCGQFTVRLRAERGRQGEQSERTGYISVQEAIGPGFSLDQETSCAPAVVRFTDESWGPVRERIWDFGDGERSGETSPEHRYDGPGVYDVTLTARGECDSVSIIRQSCIVVGAAPCSEYTYTWKPGGTSFTYEPDDAELVVRFDDISPGRLDSLAAVYHLERLPATPEGPFGFFRTLAVGAAATVAALRENPLVRAALPAMRGRHGLAHVLPDLVSVEFHSGTPAAVQEARLRQLNLEVAHRDYVPGAFTIAVPRGASAFAVIRQLNQMEEVAYALPTESAADIQLAGFSVTEPSFGNQWAFENNCACDSCDSLHCTPEADVRLVEASDSCAFDYTRGDTNTVIAIIDPDGFRLGHPDLVLNILERGSRDWYFDFNCPDSLADSCRSPRAPTPFSSHGTECAGVAAATLDCPEPNCSDSTGIVGACPECSILPIRYRGGGGTPAGPLLRDAVKYIRDYVDTLGAKAIISMSFFKGGQDPSSWEAFHQQLDSAYCHDDIVLVACAGNFSNDTIPWYPAAWPSVLSVTATDRTDSLACYANWGESVDVAAPGGEQVPQYGEHACCEPQGECPGPLTDFGVYTTTTYPIDHPYHWWVQGTSFAAPLVAGVAGLIRSAYPELSAQAVREIIESTADTVHADPNPGSIYYYDPDTRKCPALGHGRVNAFRALRTAVTSVPDVRPPGLASVQVEPNPLREGSGTWFLIPAPPSRDGSLVVYDVRGRRVRRLFADGITSEHNRIWWDARDDHGVVLAPGVYFVDLKTRNGHNTQKVTIVR